MSAGRNKNSRSAIRKKQQAKARRLRRDGPTKYINAEQGKIIKAIERFHSAVSAYFKGERYYPKPHKQKGRKMKILIALIALIALTACVKDNSNYKISWEEMQKKLPKEPSCRVNVKETIKVKGVLDGKGCIYFWTGKGKESCHGDEEVSETEPRMFVMEPGSTIKNMVIDCSPDGILMNDDTTIDNVTVRDCGEDCVTTNGKNNVIRNSEFNRGDDKCFQLNGPATVKIQNNKFKYCKIGLSGSGAKNGGAHPIEVSGNKFFNVKTVILAQRNHEFRVKNNEAKDIECFFETKEEGVIYNEGKQSITNGELNCPRGTKNIK